ncbi:helix-turn-helix domain-containing protein [Litorimonas sp.]|jgi:chromosomal replication initiation ATPase DnaA|uniref:helix-turn-helix domain-containing protein n=1 Tax=Litorimonas sp. TaxID=1892381 RepID=UPI003A8A70E1
MRRPPHPKIIARQTHQAGLAIAAVALEFGIAEPDLIDPPCASPHLRFTRQLAMYLTHIVYELNPTHIARIFLKDRSTVAHALKVIEDCREDAVLDMKIIRLENFLRQSPKAVETEAA